MGRAAAILISVLSALLFTFLAAAPVAADGELGGGWVRTDLVAAGRILASASSAQAGPGDVLTIVFEGDGAAHDRKGRPSGDPTPRRATGLQIARAWPQGPTAWLGRLCQYTLDQDAACASADWTSARYGDAAIAAADAAVDQLKARADARQVRLVGWSGGGTLAVLVAARRQDVAGLVTLAAPLDLAAWTEEQGLSPLTLSRDPADLAPMPHIPQVHLLGRFDAVVPPEASTDAARRLAGASGVVEVWSERHACCWAKRVDVILVRAASAGSALSGTAAGQAAHQPPAAP